MSDFQTAERAFHLRDGGFAIVHAHLGGEEDLVAQARGGEEIAKASFRLSVGGRGVDELAAPGDEGLQHLGAHVELFLVVLEVEDDRRADAHRRQHLAGGGNPAREEAGLREGGE